MARQSGSKRRKRTPRDRSATAVEREISLLLGTHAMDGALDSVFSNAATSTRRLLRGRTASRGMYFTAREQLAHGLIKTALRACGGDAKIAARILGVSPSLIKAAAPLRRRR